MELTDPAKELAALARMLVGAKGGGRTFEGLAEAIGISADEPDYVDLVSVMQRRVKELETFAQQVNDPELEKDQRKQVLKAIKDFSQLLHPKNAHAAWDSNRSSFLPKENIVALSFFSQTARRYRPLRVIPKDARNEVAEKIQEAREAVAGDEELEEWVRTLLLSGLERIGLVIRHLEFFGHEAAISELVLAHSKWSFLHEAAHAETTSANSSSIQRALFVLSLAGNLFILPDQALTAYDRYKEWPGKWTNYILNMIAAPPVAPEQRLLPPPIGIRPREDQEVAP